MAKRGTQDGTKNKMLAATLGVGHGVTFGLLCSLWDKVSMDFPTGELTDKQLRMILLDAGWHHAGALDSIVSALANHEHKWLDSLPNGNWYIHDWHEHADDLVHTKLFRSIRTFANGRKPKPAKVNKSERRDIDKAWKSAVHQSGTSSAPDWNHTGTQPSLALPSLALPLSSAPATETKSEEAQPQPPTEDETPKKPKLGVLDHIDPKLHGPIHRIAAEYQMRRYGGVNPAATWLPPLLAEIACVMELAPNVEDAETRLTRALKAKPSRLVPRDASFCHVAEACGLKEPRHSTRSRDRPRAPMRDQLAEIRAKDAATPKATTSLKELRKSIEAKP